MLDVVGVARVAAVDNHVTLVEYLGQRGHGVAGGATGRNHDPHHARRLQASDQGLEGLDVGHLGVAVEAHHVMARAAQPLAHIAAHLPQTDQAELHVTSPSSGVALMGVSWRNGRASAHSGS